VSNLPLTFIACCYNEAENIPALLNEIERTMSNSELDWNVLLVDDGSWDDSAALIAQLSETKKYLKYLCLTRNFGKEAAICAGLDAIVEGRAALLLDADGQHPMDAVLPMIEKLRAGADMVVAVPNERASGIFNKAFSRAYHWFIKLSTRQEITHGGGDFRLLNSKQVKRIKLMREHVRYMKGLYSYPGGRIETVKYQERPRPNGKSTFSLASKVRLAIDGIISFTTMPLRAFFVIGLMVLVVSAVYLIYILFEIALYGRSAPGFASLLFSIMVLNGLIMVQVGVQGEYIAQLLKEVKQRPIYLVDEEQSKL
jgi:glycosyltransferase involved in cell wall biosynthesis